MTKAKLFRIGLTGGVASGKSTVARLLREAGIRVVDLDQVGRELQALPEVIAFFAKCCGPSVVKEGVLDRRAVREILFADSNVRSEVEAYLHPRVLNQFLAQCAEAEAAGEARIVCEAALLIEAGYTARLDYLIVVVASPELRKKRLRERDGADETLAEKMLSAQTDDQTRIAAADLVLENNGAESELKKQLQKWLEKNQ